MITKDGYAQMPVENAEGIVVTFARSMMKEQGGMKNFLKNFIEVMEDEDAYWMHKCSNGPTKDVAHVYIIVANRLYGRVSFGGLGNEPTTGLTADGREQVINWKYLILAGPLERCPFKRTLKGFQGFRYCTKLF